MFKSPENTLMAEEQISHFFLPNTQCIGVTITHYKQCFLANIDTLVMFIK